ncbi:uncharacterized protein METZ01_LOCUS210036, partial [marine metagenome]
MKVLWLVPFIIAQSAWALTDAEFQ